MKHKIQNIKYKKGSVLVITLIIFGIIVVTALSVAITTLRGTRTSMQSSKTDISYQNADEGIDKVMTQILKKSKTVSSGYIHISDVLGGATCVGNKIVSAGTNDYAVELLGTCQSSGFALQNYHIDCNANGLTIPTISLDSTKPCDSSSTDNDISKITKLKSAGNDNNSGTQRVVLASVDQKDPKVKLLLHFDGPVGSATIPDNSRTHHTVTNSNSKVALSSTVPLPGISPNYSYAVFNSANSANLQISDSVIGDWKNISSGGISPLTVDFWANLNGDSTPLVYRTFFQLRDSSGIGDSLTLYYVPNSKMITVGRAGTINISCNYDAKTDLDFLATGWMHIAVVEDANKEIKLFIGGKKKSFLPACMDNGNININQIYIGKDGSGDYFSGYIDEFRFFAGQYWSDNFKPPTAPY